MIPNTKQAMFRSCRSYCPFLNDFNSIPHTFTQKVLLAPTTAACYRYRSENNVCVCAIFVMRKAPPKSS